MVIFTPNTTQAASPTTSGSAVNVVQSEYVRLFNSGTAIYLVTLEDIGGTDIGTFSMAGGEVAIIRKRATDKIFSANAEILLTGINIVETGQPRIYNKSAD
jgi:hypothetical protein